jgi:hypothetical protein
LPDRVLSLDLKAIAGTAETIDGLLGADFFAGRCVQIDFGARVLRVLAKEERGSLSGERLPMARRNNCFCVQVSLEGEGTQWMRLDTGCDSAIEWVAMKPNASAGSASPGRASGSSVRLGKLSVPGVSVGRHAKPFFAGEGGLVGNGFLGRFCVTVDATQGLIILGRS